MEICVCRTISRFLYLFRRRGGIIPLGRPLLTGSSDLPGSLTERAAPPPLFGLAPHGVCPASRITPDAVRSYRTFSPLPDCDPAVYFLWHFPSTTPLSASPRPLAGMLPYGDRTFLPPKASDHPSGRQLV